MSKLFEFIFIVLVIGVMLFAIYGFINDNDMHDRIERNCNDQIKELKIDINRLEKPKNTIATSSQPLIELDLPHN